MQEAKQIHSQETHAENKRHKYNIDIKNIREPNLKRIKQDTEKQDSFDKCLKTKSNHLAMSGLLVTAIFINVIYLVTYLVNYVWIYYLFIIIYLFIIVQNKFLYYVVFTTIVTR